MTLVSSVRGMQDLVPEHARQIQAVERELVSILDAFAYEPVRLPLIEKLALFSRGVGEATDIVEKEMFRLASRDEDGSNDVQVLRPEGTASCVRMLLEQGLIFNQIQRVYYSGPMFRYERPQKGRYREFYQVGVEVFGLSGADLDAELLQMGQCFWQALGIAPWVSLQVNNIGSSADRASYGAALTAYLQPLVDQLDADSASRLERNPLRILDSKSATTQALLADAPRLSEFVSTDSKQHFEQLQALLVQLNIEFSVNERLVRGLDYYNNTVFEWVTTELGAQGTICAGGRYDGLVSQLGGRETPAAGFAVGVERVQLLRAKQVPQAALALPAAAQGYICVLDDQTGWAMLLAQQLRVAMPGVRIRLHSGGGKLQKQLKKADQSGADWALIVGSDEVTAESVTVKPLRGGEQVSVPVVQLPSWLQNFTAQPNLG
jgi:histidyl-tRNA synthetase